MGNIGTATRLLMGLVASHPITATFVGDASLSGRPMGRVIDPLAQMGADISASPSAKGTKTLPLMVRGLRSEEHTSELQSLMCISYAVFCLKNKNSYLLYITTQHSTS